NAMNHMAMPARRHSDVVSFDSLSQPAISLTLFTIYGVAGTWTLAARKYKKPLVWTARSRRIYTAALLLCVLISAAFVSFALHAPAGILLYLISVALLGCYCASHVIVIAADFILKPVEKAIYNRYYNDAASRLRSMPDLKIIGITGSYGKTSTKHYLYRILSEQYDTLMTPGSYNTTLGVVRTIREMLKPYNEVFIVEMGAKSRGDIKEICDLVHPSIGIITAVGPQHLESFKTIENVQAAKFELADALPADGTAIVNDDFDKIADRTVDNAQCVRYGVRAAGTDYRAADLYYSAEGTTFTVYGPGGYKLPLRTRLMGECNVSDLLAAVAAAKVLGIPDNKIASAVAAIEPVEHRLSIKRTPGGITILDDAFNSNPIGSRMALEVLGEMPGGKRIVITPGMIELGVEQYELNRQLGETISKNVDVAIIVGKYNRDAIVEGIRSTGRLNEKALHTADTFADAQNILSRIAAKGDTVLYENDLPDTFK
ncbi:MAG: UDP-N-acetylmuramoyl-tripeptide--D-alanyl-D-alanine ligase, partial [Muribaculaceae bacterium]|nr:UDP-N-acetylmuramoyl-tripeptide--D-alanyl-D-alanine ligase [Muribaculaceae bacterium]